MAELWADALQPCRHDGGHCLPLGRLSTRHGLCSTPAIIMSCVRHGIGFQLSCDIIEKASTGRGNVMKWVRFNGCALVVLFAMVFGMCICISSNAEAGHCAAIIYEHANYRGRYQCLQEGRYNVEDLTIGNDTLSSVRVSRGNIVHLYKHRDFSGRRGVLKKDSAFVGDSWNDIVSSIIVQ